MLPKDSKYIFKKIPNKKVYLALLPVTLELANHCKDNSAPADTVGFIHYTWVHLTEKDPHASSIKLYAHILRIAKSLFYDLPKIAKYGSLSITKEQYRSLKTAGKNKNILLTYYKYVSFPQKEDILDLTLLTEYKLDLSIKENVSEILHLSKNIKGWLFLVQGLKNSYSRPLLICKMLTIMSMINCDNPFGLLSITRVLTMLYVFCLHAVMERVEYRSVTPWNLRLMIPAT